MLFLLLLPLVFPAVYALVEGRACKQVTSSECAPASNTGLNVPSEAACRDVCEVYASSGLGCTFAAWEESATSTNCRLYSLPFWQFLRGCKKLGGPPDLTGCDVEHPEDNTCDAVRDGDCFYYGNLVESVDTMDSWESCEAYCRLNSDCKAWTFRGEPSLECQLLATDDRTCDISYSPSGIDPDYCDQAATGLLVLGGHEAPTSVELWSPGTSCALPSLPSNMTYGPTVDILHGVPVACYSTSCYQLTATGWLHYQDTLHNRTFHTSAVLEEGLLIVGGEYSPSTTEVLPVDGGEAREGFSLDPLREHHCSIQVNPTTIILSGGGWSYRTVFEYSNLGGEVTTRQLPDHLTGHWYHACSFYTMGQSQVLIVTGGWSQPAQGPPELLGRTELLDLSDPGRGWRAAGQLPSPRRGLHAARIGLVVYLTGGRDDNGSVDSILSWSPDTESWDQAGALTAARYFHGVTEVSLAAVEDYCTVL